MVCQEQTHLMVLSKEGFDKIIGAFQEQIMREKLDFLKSFQFLDSLPTSQLMSLLHYFKISSYPQKTVLYNQGDKVTDIYFIKSGEVEILKSVIIEDEEYRQNQREQESSKKLYEMNMALKNKIKTKKNMMVPIKLLGAGQCFGEDEVIEDQEQRTHKVIVTQHAEIYNIPKDYVMASLKSQKGLNILHQQKQVKQSWIQERESFVTQKKAENNDKLKEELKLMDKKKKERLNYSEMQEGIKLQQLMRVNSQDNMNQSRQSITSPLRNSIFGSQLHSPTPKQKNSRMKIRHQNSCSDSPFSQNLSPINSLYPVIDQLAIQNYSMLDEFKANQKFGSADTPTNNKQSFYLDIFFQSLWFFINKSETSRTPLKNSPFQKDLNKSGDSTPQLQSPNSRHSNKSSLHFEFKETDVLNQSNEVDQIEEHPNISNQNSKLSQMSLKPLEKNPSKFLPNISLFDYKPPLIELEFKSHSQYVNMQEQTTKSKVFNIF